MQSEADQATVKPQRSSNGESPMPHRLRLWHSVDDDDVMARCMCGEAWIGSRLCDVATKWAEHMDEVRLAEEVEK